MTVFSLEKAVFNTYENSKSSKMQIRNEAALETFVSDSSVLADYTTFATTLLEVQKFFFSGTLFHFKITISLLNIQHFHISNQTVSLLNIALLSSAYLPFLLGLLNTFFPVLSLLPMHPAKFFSLNCPLFVM